MFILLSIFSLAETISLRIQCPGMRRAVVSRCAIAPFDKFSFVSLQFSLTERMYFHLPNKIKQKKTKNIRHLSPFRGSLKCGRHALQSSNSIAASRTSGVIPSSIPWPLVPSSHYPFLWKLVFHGEGRECRSLHHQYIHHPLRQCQYRSPLPRC